METKLEIAKRVIKENFEHADCGIFDTRNIAGDSMVTIYEDGELTIDICYDWLYFEVFGLTDEEFMELAEYYADLGGQ